jgi:hypothetical protein
MTDRGLQGASSWREWLHTCAHTPNRIGGGNQLRVIIVNQSFALAVQASNIYSTPQKSVYTPSQPPLADSLTIDEPILNRQKLSHPLLGQQLFDVDGRVKVITIELR